MGNETRAPGSTQPLRAAHDASVAPAWQSIADLPVALAVFDRDVRYLAASHRWLRDYGLQGRGVVGMLHYAVFPEISERWKAIHQRGLAGETVVAQEDCFERVDGSVQWLNWEVRPWHDAGGAIGGIQIWSEDVTARVEAEAQLRERHERLLETQRLANLGSWEWEAATDTVTWSDELFRIAGRDPSGPAPMFAEQQQMFTPESFARLSLAVDRALAQGEPYDLDLELVRPDGTHRGVTSRGQPVCDAGGRVIGLRGTLLDITERKREEEALKESQAQLHQAQKLESVGRLAGGVGHDYNNMLAVIIGHTELGLLRADVPADLRDDLTEIHKAATHSAEITQQLLTFARRQVIKPHLLDLNATVAHSLKMLRPLIGERVQFTWEPAADLWPVTMDTSQVEQILANLCLNARDAIGGVGTLVVTTSNRVVDATLCETLTEAVPGDYVKLTVTDNGRGISREVLAHIFEPFFTTKSLGNGSGLGLASVYGAVRQNGGFCAVASVVGEGTTFDLYLPRSAETLAAPTTLAPAAPLHKGHETILVVEDEPAVRRMTVQALETQGYDVLAADGPRAALRLAQAHGGNIALMLTDVQMPEMNGHELAETLRSAQPRVKHIFMSGYPMQGSGGDSQMEDAAHFLAKPFSLAALTAKVREVLDGG